MSKNTELPKIIANEQGRAIARGMTEENARKERNQASAEKRKQTMLRNAAEKVFRNY